MPTGMDFLHWLNSSYMLRLSNVLHQLCPPPVFAVGSTEDLAWEAPHTMWWEVPGGVGVAGSQALGGCHPASRNRAVKSLPTLRFSVKLKTELFKTIYTVN